LPRRCVYTVLTGGYETLNEQAVAAESSLPFICLTDDPALRSDTWEIRVITPMFAADPIRSQRAAKLLAAFYLPDFDASLYIDNSVRLLVAPDILFEEYAGRAGLCLPLHSFRDTLLDEFLAVAEDGLDDPRRIAAQLEDYRAAFPEILEQKPAWSAVMLRDHRDSKVTAAMQIWFAHLCRYSRRDQLSNLVAFHLAGLQPLFLDIDNHGSRFHSWPHATERRAEARLWPADDTAVEGRILALEVAFAAQRREVDELATRLEVLRHEHEVLLRSTTWRMMEPVRRLGRWLRRS
jgi:hypothetical protein